MSRGRCNKIKGFADIIFVSYRWDRSSGKIFMGGGNGRGCKSVWEV